MATCYSSRTIGENKLGSLRATRYSDKMIRPAILVVTGPSGAGKTAAVRCLEARGRPDVGCFYFDSIGVPSEEVMKRDFGGGEGWQAEATKRWISRLAIETIGGEVSILDGQTRPSFVRAALAESEGIVARVVLVDCAASVRNARLAMRGHPELATARMDIWAGYLRGQADALQLPIIDTTRLNIEAVADALGAEAEAVRAEARGAAQPAVAANGASPRR